mmetsp:Transcript_10855/g.33288  ORF Transcript_10855/g.33288 Transcript_10855/m.33288 type:complete len:312 (+) Transcript_10855:183-1118(+)|eukprot:CAMPEP_0198731736 /NCGR_PEP_ID=MMETSP1475-20131203/31823_1 /TAXON_ID= ORGANISM="Unidentified sp., Strain CCMP1999" /NCGR_SAMPLE_ID=MMETSP1475 /ASSEMBLY_ACC=CAM_ASM_001111 /LENGTH=311 /DNA_ID=CAMNT_0044494741 /DNA_START=107 /DNA_END=1042 /DNA_ORIENTATION=-
MSDDKPKFKPNVSGAGSRRGRGRARSAQLVPQRGVGRGAGRGLLRPQPPDRTQSVPLSELRRLEVSGQKGVAAVRGSASAAGPAASSASARAASAVKSEVHEVSTGQALVSDQKKEEVLLAQLDENFDSDEELLETKASVDDKRSVAEQVLQPVSLPLVPHHVTDKIATAGSALLNPGVSMLQLPAALPVQLSALRNMSFDRVEGMERGKSLPSDLRTISGDKVKFGKLRVHRSGKVTLGFGDVVEMIVEPGAPCQFAQHLFEVNTADGEATEIVEISDRLVAVPDLEKLLIDTPEVKTEPLEGSRKPNGH